MTPSEARELLRRLRSRAMREHMSASIVAHQAQKKKKREFRKTPPLTDDQKREAEESFIASHGITICKPAYLWRTGVGRL